MNDTYTVDRSWRHAEFQRLRRADEIAQTQEDLMTDAHIDNDDLLDEYLVTKAAAEAWRKALHEIEAEITRRMEADGATEMVAGGQTATLKLGRATLDPARILAIYEHLTEQEVQDSGAYIPEHMAKVAAMWSLQKLNKFRKRHKDIAATIDAATMRGRPRLVVTSIKKEEAKA